METSGIKPSASRVAKSVALFRRAEELIPGGTQLISRRPSRLAMGISPVYAERAQGARIWDVDGNEYVDWVSGIGAVILGYRDPDVDEAVIRQIQTCPMTSINHELELELAELLIERVPCAEMVRYAKGGGEACAMAVRIARGITGRDKILFCGYHGWHDWYLAANLGGESALNPHLFPGIEATGVPRCLEGTAIPFPYADADALGELLEANRNQVAAVIMEPLRSEVPPQNYLAEVARLAKEHNVLLIFDEVSTGFRPSAGGIQPVVDVTPDLAVFAKSIANGYPMAAVVGRREVMEPISRMFISSTFWSDPLGLRAALVTLKEVANRDVPGHCRELGKRLKSLVETAASQTGCPVVCRGVDFHPQLAFQVSDEKQSQQLTTLYVQEMAKRGCHGFPAFYLNAAQGEAELAQTGLALNETFRLLADGLERGNLENLLECELRQDVFRRLVR